MKIRDILMEAADLQEKKAEDYRIGVQLHEYFPFGSLSYIQMIHTKSLRLVSLGHKKKDSQYESIRDTCLDIINYSAFFIHAIDEIDRIHNGVNSDVSPTSK